MRIFPIFSQKKGEIDTPYLDNANHAAQIIKLLT